MMPCISSAMNTQVADYGDSTALTCRYPRVCWWRVYFTVTLRLGIREGRLFLRGQPL